MQHFHNNDTTYLFLFMTRCMNIILYIHLLFTFNPGTLFAISPVNISYCLSPLALKTCHCLLKQCLQQCTEWITKESKLLFALNSSSFTLAYTIKKRRHNQTNKQTNGKEFLRKPFKRQTYCMIDNSQTDERTKRKLKIIRLTTGREWS